MNTEETKKRLEQIMDDCADVGLYGRLLQTNVKDISEDDMRKVIAKLPVSVQWEAILYYVRNKRIPYEIYNDLHALGEESVVEDFYARL